MKLVFLVEEPSMKEFLAATLPGLVPEGTVFQIIAHEGKKDLERSIPRKLRAWQEPGARFIVLRDQDSAPCVELKAKIRKLCEDGYRPDTLIRIVCRELESWLLGDLESVAKAFNMPKLATLANKEKYRDPDRLGSPSQTLAELILGYGKVRGARLIGAAFNPDNCCSTSFQQFRTGLQRVLATPLSGLE